MAGETLETWFGGLMLQVGKSDQVRRQSGSRCTEAGLVSES